MSTPDIVVIGSCNVDFTFYTSKMPKRGETIYGRKFTIGYGGKGANQCAAVAKLGASAALVAKLGSDHFGHEFLSELQQLNINTEYIELLDGVATGVAQITVSESEGDNYILIVEGANKYLRPSDIEHLTDLLKETKIVIFQFETPVDTTLAAMKLIKEQSNALIILNPSPVIDNVDPIIFALTDVIVANETEAERFTTHPISSPSDAKPAIDSFLKFGCKTVIITLGSNGAVLATNTVPEPFHVAVEPISNPVDTTGAGDLFLGALAYSFVYKKDLELEKQVKFSCDIARECVTRRGSQKSFPFKKDILHLLK